VTIGWAALALVVQGWLRVVNLAVAVAYAVSAARWYLRYRRV
jgi:hypothetical protein